MKRVYCILFLSSTSNTCIDLGYRTLAMLDVNKETVKDKTGLIEKQGKRQKDSALKLFAAKVFSKPCCVLNHNKTRTE